MRRDLLAAVVVASTISTGFGFGFGQLTSPTEATAQGSSNAAVVRELRKLNTRMEAVRKGVGEPAREHPNPDYAALTPNQFYDVDLNDQLDRVADRIGTTKDRGNSVMKYLEQICRNTAPERTFPC